MRRRSQQFSARIIVSAILGALLFPGLASAAEQWTKLETPNFELYTTAGEKKGREAILYFEQVRSFFLQASASKRAPEVPVRIVAFRSESQYKPYRMSESAAAYYTHTRNRDYIVMQDISSELYPAAIHEYTHLIIQHLGLKLPVWLNEGWADVYSSLRPRGNKALVGDLLPGRVQTLVNSKWLDLSVLASVDHNSPMYNERDKAGIFYAQSWILVHMLYLSPGYSANFTKFVVAVANGQDTAQAFQSVYGKGLKEVAADLDRYVKNNKFYGALFDVKLEKSAEDPQVSEATPLESGLVLADLLSLVHKTEEARQAYEQLAKDHPDQPEPEESLGYLAWQAGDQESARQHFSRAYAAGTKNAQLCYDYATLERRESKDVVPFLRRAVELKPDYVEARMFLGLLLADQRSYADAIEQLRQIKNIGAEQAPRYFSALAYSYWKTGDLDQARKSAEAAKKWAKTPAETEQADSILRALDAPPQAASAKPAAREANTPPFIARRPAPASEVHETAAAPKNPFVQPGDQMAHVEGVAQRLDCSGVSARFHILAGKTAMAFEIPDPGSVLIKHSGEMQHDFACGPQKAYHVAVDYAVKPDAKKGTAGIVRELEF
ncbi:MAG TPA: tetratricopeptide repeat protein [Bryobacteraceae bacterium]|nr:tetratricopeptide repeat protein [Bryobacteraceae bacterium]